MLKHTLKRSFPASRVVHPQQDLSNPDTVHKIVNGGLVARSRLCSVNDVDAQNAVVICRRAEEAVFAVE
jgi:hypothetical protein